MTTAFYYAEIAAALSMFVTAGVLLAMAASPKGRSRREVLDTSLALSAFMFLIGASVARSANEGEFLFGMVKILAAIPAVQASLHLGAARVVKNQRLRKVAYFRALSWGAVAVAATLL